MKYVIIFFLNFISIISLCSQERIIGYQNFSFIPCLRHYNVESWIAEKQPTIFLDLQTNRFTIQGSNTIYQLSDMHRRSFNEIKSLKSYNEASVFACITLDGQHKEYLVYLCDNEKSENIPFPQEGRHVDSYKGLDVCQRSHMCVEMTIGTIVIGLITYLFYVQYL